MVRVIKYFADSKDDFKPCNVGEEKDFGADRNAYLVKLGYAEWIKQEKIQKVEAKKKPNRRKAPEAPKPRTIKGSKK